MARCKGGKPLQLTLSGKILKNYQFNIWTSPTGEMVIFLGHICFEVSVRAAHSVYTADINRNAATQHLKG